MKVLNFGSVNVDFTYRVDHFVRPGETLSARSVTRNAGGKGFNQSVALARAGCTVYHAGHIGPDGDFLLELCREEGVRTDHLTQVETPTGNAVIQVDDRGENCILLYGGANQTMELPFIQDVLAHFGPGDLIVLQNEINHLEEILYQADARGLQIALNPAPITKNMPLQAMALAAWLILNETEAEGLTGSKEPEGQLDELERRFPRAGLVLTLGERGGLYRKDGRTIGLGTCPVQAMDTTAAGDTFVGYFLAGVSRGESPEQALATATKASALAVTRQGAAQSIPKRKEVDGCGLVPQPFQ